MKERPILFSGPMVRALLDGTKTQTRRAVRLPKDLPAKYQSYEVEVERHGAFECALQFSTPSGYASTAYCPYGAPGDRMWVRETFYAFGRWETRFSAKKGRDEWHFIDMTLELGKAYVYAADGPPHDFTKGNQRSTVTPAWWKRPAIHMPRIACRSVLDIADVRVERLQDISEADAIAEGVEFDPNDPDPFTGGPFTAKEAYRLLWKSLNGAESWAANPWVWVVEFKKVTP